MNDQERLAEYANDIRDNLSEIIDILSEKEYLAERVENLEKESARLRQALENIAYKGFNVEPKRIVVKMQSLARKALEGESE